MTLNHLTKRLKRHHSSKVARASGVHVNTVRAIRNGVNTNPLTQTVEKLNAALDAMEGRNDD